MKRVLLIEDCPEIGNLVKLALNSYEVRQAVSLRDAEQHLLKPEFDMLIIDVSLPDGNGYDLCLKLSQTPEYQKTPRILLTAKDQPAEKVYGFSCGALDYITKPFHSLELKARVDRFFGPATDPSDGNIQLSSFTFNLAFQKCHVIRDGKAMDLNLTPTEFRLLLTLVKREGEVLTRNQLEQSVWEAHGTTIEARGIDTHISHLRKKLDDLESTIVSVYGQGYSFKSKSVSQAA